jgi:hypothetical protein
MEWKQLIRLAAQYRGQPLVYSWDLSCARSGDLDRLLVRLLEEEAVGTCDQCGVGDCTHQSALLVLAERHEADAYSWDRACDQGYSYQGYGLDELLRQRLALHAQYWCSYCRDGCTHSAARATMEEIAIAEKGGRPALP